MDPTSSGATARRVISLAYLQIARLVVAMPVCTQNVKKRKARRMKNDRLQAAKRMAKAKS
jgi:hypothetical protein